MKNYRKNNDSVPLAISLAQKSGLPIDVLGGYPQIKILSGRELVIEGKCRLLEYSREKICVICGKTHLSVSGRGLNVRLMDECALVVIGIIVSVTFEE